jgi:hypothetical protein
VLAAGSTGGVCAGEIRILFETVGLATQDIHSVVLVLPQSVFTVSYILCVVLGGGGLGLHQGRLVELS